MSPSEISSLLRRVLARRVRPVDESRRDAELDALMAAHARNSGPKGREDEYDDVTRPRRVAKWSLAAGLFAAAAVGACVVPVDYEAEMGQRLAFVVSAQELAELDVEAIARYIDEEHDPEEVRIEAHAEITQHDESDETVHEVRVQIEAIGAGLDADALWDGLLVEFPALADARREDEALRGVVHGTLGGRLSHAWLDVTIDRDGVEEAERQLIEQLTAQGVTGAQVEIIDEGVGDMRRREVRVRIEE